MNEITNIAEEDMPVVENLDINVNYINYSITPPSNASASVIIHGGKLIAGNNDSINAIDTDQIVISSVPLINISIPGSNTSTTLYPVKNGDFEDDFNDWTIVNGAYGYWTTVSDPILNSRVAFYDIPFGIPRNRKETTSFYQYINITEKPDKIVLRFKYFMDYSTWPLPGFIRDYDLTVSFYNDSWSKTYDYTTSGGTWVTEEIDITSFFTSTGIHKLQFTVFMWTGPLFTFYYFNTRIDDVELILTYYNITPGVNFTLNYHVDVEIDTTIVDCYNFTNKLRSLVNISVPITTYIYDEADNVWIESKKFIPLSNEWFNITYDTEKLRIRAESYYPFEFRIDYLHINRTILDTKDIELVINNKGTEKVYIVSLWLRNNTFEERIPIEEYLEPSHSLPMNITVTLTKGSTYEIRVITRHRRHCLIFTP